MGGTLSPLAARPRRRARVSCPVALRSAGSTRRRPALAGSELRLATPWSRLHPRAGQRLPRQPAAAHVLPGRGGRRFGEQTTTFRLEHSALRPLVDVGRVFALAARDVFGRSTLERFAIARTLLPEHDAIFREAADTLQIVLWQQGRVGISQGTRGAELPAALFSRHDRQVLRAAFAPSCACSNSLPTSMAEAAVSGAAVFRPLSGVFRRDLDRRDTNRPASASSCSIRKRPA